VDNYSTTAAVMQGKQGEQKRGKCQHLGTKARGWAEGRKTKKDNGRGKNYDHGKKKREEGGMRGFGDREKHKVEGGHQGGSEKSVK